MVYFFVEKQHTSLTEKTKGSTQELNHVSSKLLYL